MRKSGNIAALAALGLLLGSGLVACERRGLSSRLPRKSHEASIPAKNGKESVSSKSTTQWKTPRVAASIHS